jgi:nucleoside-diphosphate-sugar epimerase
MNNKLLIFGFGYSAIELANLCNKSGNWTVIGTSRRPDSFKDSGFSIVNFESKSVTESLKGTTHVLVSTPTDADNRDPTFVQFSKLIAEHASTIKWLGYLSSTGVYGNFDGKWIDETAETNPVSESGHSRVAIEKEWVKFGAENKIATQVFRLSGIYGPDRNYLIDLKAGRARSIYKKDQIFNRIHVKDIAGSVFAAMSLEKPAHGEIYNVSDDLPAASHEVMEYGASLLGIEPPVRIDYETADISPRMREFYNSSKRIKNDKLKRLLGKELEFPTYKEGLKSLL